MSKNFFIFIIHFIIFSNIKCQNCPKDITIEDTECFNNVTIFNVQNKFYRAGHFALNKNGDMIIEYSYDKYRLFYGLKKDGKYFFPNITKEIEIVNTDGNSTKLQRYESINSFIFLINDANKEKEYLLSLSSNLSLIELHDLENDSFKTKEHVSFYENRLGTISYIFQILEAKLNNNQNLYFCIYIYINEENFKYDISIKKFGFLSSNGDINKLDEITISDISLSRITSSIIIEPYNLLLVFYIKTNTNIYVKFYDYNLNEEDEKSLLYMDTFDTEGNFFKAYYLEEKYVAFAYFKEKYNFQFKILELTGDSINSYQFSSVDTISYENSLSSLKKNITLNDFIKVNNERFIFITTSNYKDLFISFFDLFNNYQSMAVRIYHYNLGTTIKQFTKEFSGFIYNDFLSFTATVISQENSGNFFSIFMVFGYPNGTDLEIDISPYFSDSDNYDSSYNLYDYLIRTMKIDNNIFAFQKVDRIKLTSIPEEILFYNGYDNTLISNNSIIDSNYILKQNTDKVKENKYYYLDYQFIAREPDFDTYFKGNNVYKTSFIGTTETEFQNYYIQKYFFGRTNTLKFKLCYEYCKTCINLGVSSNEQKCQSCLDEYSYNYIGNSYLVCTPENYYYDFENKLLKPCSEGNTKYFINRDTNKSICFKYDYDCPSGYQDFNTETNECKYAKQSEGDIDNKTDKSELINNTIKHNPQIINLETQVNKEDYIKENIEQDLLFNFSYINKTNEDINNKINNELLNQYKVGQKSIEIIGEKNTVFQLTTSENELLILQGKGQNNNISLSVIELGECENILKQNYGIVGNLSLIIKKLEQLSISSERNVQYEVYHPISKIKLNLSLCESEPINIYVPVTLNDELLELYEDLQKSGYDLFNIKDPFYNDLCTPYKSENGTDVLLTDRKNDYYNNNYTTCQTNCEYSSYNSQYQFLKCECRVVVDDIDISNFDKFTKKIYKNFYDILKNSNYKVLKCYNLVFNLKYLKKNIGSFVVLTFFICYLLFLLFYIIKGILPIKEDVKKIMNDKFSNNMNNFDDFVIHKNYKGRKNINSKTEKKKLKHFPPKKRKTAIIKSKLSLGDNQDKKRKSIKTKSINNRNKSLKEDKTTKNKNNKKLKKLSMSETHKDILEFSQKKKNNSNRKSFEKLNSKVNNHNNSKKNFKNLDDLVLANLSYEEAIDLDKRKFIQIYLSKLKKKHLIIFTFFTCNDHNLIYIKLSRFFFLVCTNMAMNVLFFFDSSMHKIYLDYGKYNFIQQIPQILYSSIVTLIIDILIGLLSYTDVNIYEIRQIKEYNEKSINRVLRNIKIKLAIFFVITFIFFSFYWYLISAFCAVYNNTQLIYLKDFISSFAIGLLYPFVIQLLFVLMRIFSLMEKTNCRKLLYKFC